MKPYDNRFWELVSDFGKAELALKETLELLCKARNAFELAEEAHAKALNKQNYAYDVLSDYVGMAKFNQITNKPTY